MTAPAQLTLIICRRPGTIAHAGRWSIDVCYACDARAIGTRDRRPEGGLVEKACVRHADTFNGTKGAT
jgi:hypothetical protein